MCGTCGCGEHHHHDHDHEHHHHHHDEGKVITLEQDILQRNNLLAERNRGYFEAKHIFCLNLMSSPGSGKTTLLEETIRRLNSGAVHGLPSQICVIEGDQQTSNDADRIAALDVPVFQVNTGTGCHLEADMVNHAVKHLNPSDGSLLFVENVGNLVCPAEFDTGAHLDAVILSVPEGDDKPLKYPLVFEKCGLVIINKIDALGYFTFDTERCKRNVLSRNPHAAIFPVSAKTGEGMEELTNYIKKIIDKEKA